MIIKKANYDKINNICLVILASVAVVAALIYTRILLVPFVISLFFFAVLSPVIYGIQDKVKVPRFIAVILCFLILGLSTFLTWFFLLQSFKIFYINLDFYKSQAITLIKDASLWLSSFGFNIEANFFQKEIQNLPVLDWLKNFTGGLATFLGNFFLIFVFIIFLLIGENKYALPKGSIWLDLRDNVSRYIIIKFLSSLLTGLSVGILLFLLEVELAFVFAFITFLLNFIPNIGSILAASLPLPLILLTSGFSFPFFATLIGQAIIHSLIGTILEPKFLGERMDLHPIAIIMSLIFWGLVWGIPGMFLAIPITAILKIILSRIDSTKTFAELMAGRIH